MGGFPVPLIIISTSIEVHLWPYSQELFCRNILQTTENVHWFILDKILLFWLCIYQTTVLHHLPLKNMISYGVIFLKVPTFNSSTTNKKLIWTIVCLLSRVEQLWKLVEKVHLKTFKWRGWVLLYLESKVWPIWPPSD